MTYEGIRLKVLKLWRIGFANIRKKKLVSDDFTIISNNCWGGMIYESYNLKKMTPTVGLFFMANDYVKFLAHLDEYLNSELTFIRPKSSKWCNSPELRNDSRFGTYPVGVLHNGNESVEIFFLHYRNQQQALQKWTRRCKRVNFDKLLVKFNDQNGCTEKDVAEYMKLPFMNKLFFTVKKWRNINNAKYVLIKQFPRHKCIFASYEPFGKSKYIDVTSALNKLG